jgi:inosose dehydratase
MLRVHGFRAGTGAAAGRGRREILKICFDTGHHSYAGFDPVAFMKRHINRISYMHFKDIDPDVKAGDRQPHRLSTMPAGKGIFCNLGEAMWISRLCANPVGCGVSRAGARSSRIAIRARQPDPLGDAAANRAYLNPSAFEDGTDHDKAQMGHDRRRRRQPDRPGAPYRRGP